MYLTRPQSKYFDPRRFADAAATSNQFDWDLYYRFKDARDDFWLDQLDVASEFRCEALRHSKDFDASAERTRGMLALPTASAAPAVLDVGLSSEKLDGNLIDRLGARVTVVDVQSAAQAYLSAQLPGSRFVIGDVIDLCHDPDHAGTYDLVYSIGLVEHFPDKSVIVNAHRQLARPGALVLLYVPIDSEVNRRLTAMAPDLENFGYRELLTPEELAESCLVPGLEIVALESVGLFAALWARRTV
ncbi:MAG: class I SAM-dependent methyltransferase [Gammaproteobacteria bacterium]